jgi:hypothetical protein
MDEKRRKIKLEYDIKKKEDELKHRQKQFEIQIA